LACPFGFIGHFRGTDHPAFVCLVYAGNVGGNGACFFKGIRLDTSGCFCGFDGGGLDSRQNGIS
jgi:hypothetical protein